MRINCLLILLTVLVSCAEDSLTDPRDGKTYRLQQIGEQVWLEENIAFLPPDAADAKPGNTAEYGTYFSWEAAKRACPDGTHLPSLAEWMLRIGSYEGHDNPRGGRYVHANARDSSLLLGGMYRQGRLIAEGRMGLFWTASDTTSTFGVEGGEAKPAYLGIHVYGDYSIADSVNIEPTWSKSEDRLFNCKCIKD
jgi:uncharacterized protein (TIGR02145 family)